MAERRAYGEGIFRRRFRMRGEPGRVRADMEDDFHRFGLVLEHDGETVTGVKGYASRHPWTECPGAVVPLNKLVGMRLSTRFAATSDHTNPRENCTHLFDVAGLAVSHAAAGREQRQYDISVPDRIEGRTRASLHRDGELFLAWELDGIQITGPERHAGVRLLGSKFLRWAESELDADTAEAAVALRRASFIAMGRARNLDDAPSALVYMDMAGGSCHSFTPGIAEKAMRVMGSTHDFTESADPLLADLEN